MGERPLAGKVSLVTGASRGIGRAIARLLAARGATVVLGARDQARLAESVAEIESLGGLASAVSLDVADRASVDAAFDGVLKQHGRIDHLVNNAGITRDNLLLRMKRDEWEAVMATNLTGVFHCTQSALRPMLKQRSGRIVNLTSVVGITGNAGQANYSASKAGIIGFTRSMSRELAGRKVTINAVCPGFIESEMTKVLGEMIVEEAKKRIPAKRLGLPEDVAACVLFLASPAACYVTGQVLTVDGGMTG